MKRSISIIGAGNVGTAFAALLSRHKRPVRIYCIERDVEDDINCRRINSKYLHGVKLPPNVSATASIKESLEGASIVIVAVPRFALPDVYAEAAPHIATDAAIGVLTKGLDRNTGEPAALSFARLLPAKLRKRIVMIGGPAIANELAGNTPAGIILGGKNKDAVHALKRALESKTVKVASSSDIVGVSYCMALKNIYAIALGMCDGIGYPTNTKALIITLAIRELQEILPKLGGRKETAITLAGVGDVFVSGVSAHGRNRTFGERLVRAKTQDPISLGLGTVEGIEAAKVMRRILSKKKISAPLLQTVTRCLSSKSSFERPLIKFIERLAL
jgi:glycerol-3-phosphate dehydrogenase (NAD(P)+)